MVPPINIIQLNVEGSFQLINLFVNRKFMKLFVEQLTQSHRNRGHGDRFWQIS